MYKNCGLYFLLTYVLLMTVAKEIVDDDCKFLNCPTSIHIDEELPFNTGVIQMKAECKNKTTEVAYRLLENICIDYGVFKIDKKTGWINTTVPINRESIMGNTHDRITVIAEGGERSSRFLRTCSFTIEVDDINDNKPAIFYWPLEIRINSTEDPFIVDTVTACDSDDGDNGRVKYSLIGSRGNDPWPFTIDEDSGIIHVIGDLRSTNTTFYKFILNVTDRGSPPLWTARFIRVYIDSPPQPDRT